jgi:hypothetical protein
VLGKWGQTLAEQVWAMYFEVNEQRLEIEYNGKARRLC